MYCKILDTFMVAMVVAYLPNFWPFSAFKFDDIRVSDRLVKKLSIPESTKRFVYAVQEPESRAVIYVLCVQNLSERSILDVECLVREVKPDAVIAQVGGGCEVPSHEISVGYGKSDKSSGYGNGQGDEIVLPTSSFEVLRMCFLHKINREKYESVAENMVLKEIFGVGCNSHLFAAKRAAEEVGSPFLLLESHFVKYAGEEIGLAAGSVESRNSFQSLNLLASSLAPVKVVPSSGWRGFCLTNDLQSQMVKSLCSYLVNSSSLWNVEPKNIQRQVDYEPPQLARSVYPLLVDLHNIFVKIPSMGRALAHSQRMLYNINRGETVNGQFLSDVYTFRIAVEGLRVILNDVGRLPLSKLGSHESARTEFSELPTEDKLHALLAQALRSQTKKFRSIVAVIDASGLAGLRKHWNTIIPSEVKDMVEQQVTNSENDGEFLKNSDRKWLLTDKPVVAVGAGATAVFGASSLSEVVPASSFIKIVTLNVPASLKLMMAQTQKAISVALGKTLGPSKVVAQGMAGSGVKTSVMKVTASAERLRKVAHSLIASAEKTSLLVMRTAFYEIMRKPNVRRISFSPWITFGCSMATCTGALVYGDGIECAAESFPTASSIANLGRGIQSLQVACQGFKHSESSRIQNSIESLLYKFKK